MYFLQIIDEQGNVVRFPAGGLLERSVIEAFTVEIKKRLGTFNSKDRIDQAVRAGVAETIRGLKQETVRLS